MWYIILGIGVLLMLLFVWCLCRIAAISDRFTVTMPDGEVIMSGGDD